MVLDTFVPLAHLPSCVLFKEDAGYRIRESFWMEGAFKGHLVQPWGWYESKQGVRL